jgi:RHH-type rel operon transcriptional repressor/antitoxin RelB
MAKTVIVTARVEPDVKDRLRAIAASTQRSESFLAKEAIEAYVTSNEWQVTLIKKRLSQAKTGGATVPHEEVEAWMKSWGGKRERARPKPRR